MTQQTESRLPAETYLMTEVAGNHGSQLVFCPWADRDIGKAIGKKEQATNVPLFQFICLRFQCMLWKSGKSCITVKQFYKASLCLGENNYETFIHSSYKIANSLGRDLT